MLNTTYEFFTEFMDGEARSEFDRMLTLKFDDEMEPEERAREERRRLAVNIGAVKGERDALTAMRMRR